MKEEGITFVTNTNVGKDVKAAKLLKEYDRIDACLRSQKSKRYQGTGQGRKGHLFCSGFLKSNHKEPPGF